MAMLVMANRLSAAAKPETAEAAQSRNMPASMPVTRYEKLFLLKVHKNQKIQENINTADTDKL